MKKAVTVHWRWRVICALPLLLAVLACGLDLQPTSQAEGHAEAHTARAPGAGFAAGAAWRAVGNTAAGWAVRRDAGHLARPAHPRRISSRLHPAQGPAHARIHRRAVPTAALPDQPARQRQRHLPALRPPAEVPCAEPERQPHPRRGRDARPPPREPAQRVAAGHADELEYRAGRSRGESRVRRALPRRGWSGRHDDANAERFAAIRAQRRSQRRWAVGRAAVRHPLRDLSWSQARRFCPGASSRM